MLRVRKAPRVSFNRLQACLLVHGNGVVNESVDPCDIEVGCQRVSVVGAHHEKVIDVLLWREFGANSATRGLLIPAR